MIRTHIEAAFRGFLQREYLLDQTRDIIKEIHNFELQLMKKYRMNCFRPGRVGKKGQLKPQHYQTFCDEIIGFYIEKIWVEDAFGIIILFQNGVWIRAEI